jgi:hypothetical protein
MRSLTLLVVCALAAAAEEPNLIKNASFEEPAIKERTDASKGGSPRRIGDAQSSWTQLEVQVRPQDKPNGALVVGLTNEFARTGKQSVFIDFQNVSAQRRSYLMTDLLPVKAGHLYRLALWGRIDPKRPLTLDQRRPLMKLEFEYFTADPEVQCDRSDYGTQMIPGSLDRLMFFSTKWSEYFRLVRTPEDAAFIKVTLRWETDKAPGVTDGAIYFDDVSLIAVPKGESLAPLDPNAPKPPPVPDEEKENQ